MEGSLKVIETWSGMSSKVLKAHRDMEWDGLEGSLKVTEPWSGMGWEDPKRLQSHGVEWVGRS